MIGLSLARIYIIYLYRDIDKDRYAVLPYHLYNALFSYIMLVPIPN